MFIYIYNIEIKTLNRRLHSIYDFHINMAIFLKHT